MSREPMNYCWSRVSFKTKVSQQKSIRYQICVRDLYSAMTLYSGQLSSIDFMQLNRSIEVLIELHGIDLLFVTHYVTFYVSHDTSHMIHIANM